MAAMELEAHVFIIGAALLGIFFAVWMWTRVSQVTVAPVAPTSDSARDALLEENRGDEAILNKCADIQAHISEGSTSFLFTVYKYMGVFMLLMSIVVFVLLGSENKFTKEWKKDDEGHAVTPSFYNGLFSMIAFNLGAATSIAAGFLGMKIATYANARVAVEARKGIAPAFEVGDWEVYGMWILKTILMCAAFRSGSVMGFLLTSMGLLVLYVALLAFRMFYDRHDDWVGMFEAITGYGLGGSSIALFGRVGGGIYTKAADVGADLVGKVEKDIPEDDPRNPGVIADNVGDNVGDIAGMGADLFGSFAESTCAALVVASVSSIGAAQDWAGMMFPLGVTAAGIIVCLLTTLIATDVSPAHDVPSIEPTLKLQLVASTVIMTPVSAILAFFTLGTEGFTLPLPDGKLDAQWWSIFLCVAVGLWSGLIIGLVTEYYTSNAYSPVQQVAGSCRTGAATNVIFGLALGYLSVIIPIFMIAIAIFVGFSLGGMYGIACAALGMLSTMSTGLAIDAYGPISDNAGGIAEMAGMGDDIREKTDALDAAGNTTAAIGKGFAIGSAALVSLALFGAYITRVGISLEDTSILDAHVFCGLLVGAMLPYWFSAMTMKSVGDAALAMVEEVRRQFATISGLMEGTADPDYKRCVAISTDASLREMIAPGALVMLSPIIVGTLFGVQALAGLLAGALVSGVQMAISMSNTGGAWDNAKKYIEAGRSEDARDLGPKGSDAHKAAVIGDTVGDPLKDTSGPSLNILIKLMAVESLVFAPFFASAFCGDGAGLLARFFAGDSDAAAAPSM